MELKYYSDRELWEELKKRKEKESIHVVSSCNFSIVIDEEEVYSGSGEAEILIENFSENIDKNGLRNIKQHPIDMNRVSGLPGNFFKKTFDGIPFMQWYEMNNIEEKEFKRAKLQEEMWRRMYPNGFPFDDFKMEEHHDIDKSEYKITNRINLERSEE